MRLKAKTPAPLKKNIQKCRETEDGIFHEGHNQKCKSCRCYSCKRVNEYFNTLFTISDYSFLNGPIGAIVVSQEANFDKVDIDAKNGTVTFLQTLRVANNASHPHEGTTSSKHNHFCRTIAFLLVSNRLSHDIFNKF